jgi:hypothetical protein
VTYNQLTYTCLQSHTAWVGAGWTPATTPSLWSVGGDCATPGPTPQPTAIPFPTASPQPTATPRPTANPQPTATPQPTPAPGAGIGQIVRNVYVTFYGYDDNDDGNGHYGNAIISNPDLHSIATEDLGTYDHPSTFATDTKVFKPGTLIYIPKIRKYYLMEDTCVECTADRKKGKTHVDLYIGGNTQLQGQPLINCEDTLTTEGFVDTIVTNPGSNWPVNPPKVFANGVCDTQLFPVPLMDSLFQQWSSFYKSFGL